MRGGGDSERPSGLRDRPGGDSGGGITQPGDRPGRQPQPTLERELTTRTRLPTTTRTRLLITARTSLLITARTPLLIRVRPGSPITAQVVMLISAGTLPPIAALAGAVFGAGATHTVAAPLGGRATSSAIRLTVVIRTVGRLSQLA